MIANNAGQLNVLHQLSLQLRDCKAMVEGLEGAVSGLVHDGRGQVQGLSTLQDFDLLVQTLHDLAVFVEAIGQHSQIDPRRFNAALGLLRLQRVRVALSRLEVPERSDNETMF